jgi:hypothetical protein
VVRNIKQKALGLHPVVWEKLEALFQMAILVRGPAPVSTVEVKRALSRGQVVEMMADWWSTSPPPTAWVQGWSTTIPKQGDATKFATKFASATKLDAGQSDSQELGFRDDSDPRDASVPADHESSAGSGSSGE